MNTGLVASGFPPVEQARTVTLDITDLDDAASLFLRTRPSLLRIAHRIVGSPTDAEDVVQEAWCGCRAPTVRLCIIRPLCCGRSRPGWR
ncbi:sigma factor [Streptomyces pseudogriseolus]|uniref:sigma factor n=1 Tax=Streptomyces pseudogriseolus TaxID=36817 RepID=UPI003FA29F48